MASGTDHYHVLGVDRAAGAPRIRHAYRRLVRRFHPDLNPGDPVAALRYREIHRAWLVLGDPVKRSEYDRAGGSESRPRGAEPAEGYGFAGFDFAAAPSHRVADLKEILGTQPERPADEETPADIHSRVRLSFREALEGRSVRLRVARRRACPACAGQGRISRDESVPCPACEGRGKRFRRVGHMVFSRSCERCEGQGLLAHASCDACEGRGSRIRMGQELVRVPAGVADGATLVVAGKGHARPGDAPPGDLRLHVQVESHPLLERRGDNLVCPLPLTLAEAALGGRIQAPTPTGPVTLRLPPGVQPGDRFRVSGKGARSSRGGGERGDLFFEARVRIPEVRDDRSRALVEELERRNPSAPRAGLAEQFGGGSG